MKKRFLVILLALAATLCLTFALAGCGDKVDGSSSMDGIYYVYRNEKYEKNNFIKISGSNWEDDDGVSGTWERNGDALSFKGTVFGVTDEIYSGTYVSDGVLKIKVLGADIYYCKEGQTPSSGTSGGQSGDLSDKYTVTYNANGGMFTNGETYTQEVNANSLLIAPTQPKRDRYIFGGWAKDSNGKEYWQFATDKVTGNLTLYAIWQEPSASILSVEGASINDDQILMIVPPETEKVSLSNKVICSSDSSWKLYYDSMGQTEIPTRIAADLNGSLSAGDNEFYIVVTSSNGTQVNTYRLNVHRQHNITVNYYDNKNVSIKTETVLTGETYNATYTPTITGYTFNHWQDKNGNEYKSGVLFEGLSLYANATAKTYKITLNADGGSGLTTTEKTVTYDKSYSLPKLTKTGYTFLGWRVSNGTTLLTDNNGASLENWTGTSDTTLYAKWQANQYKVTVNKNTEAGGSVSGDGEHAYDSQVTLTAHTYSGYTWCGWYKGTEQVSTELSYKFKMGFAVTYTAKWIKCPVTLETSDTTAGTVSGVEKTILGAQTTITAKANRGYKFLGWFKDDNRLTTEPTYTFKLEDTLVTYSAKWELCEEMSNFVFSSTYENCQITDVKDKSVTSIIIPDYVTSISQSAFKNCTSLESITLPFVGNGSNKTLFGYIFGASSNMNNAQFIPESLKTVVITGVTSIGAEAFFQCESFTNITIPDSVTSIGYQAFYNCTSLTSVNFGNNSKLETIGEGAFSGCTSLESITIPDSVTSISSQAFSGCTSLKSITIGDGVTSIGIGAFFNCTSLASITIPDGVTSIGSNAFYKCTSIESVNLGDNSKLTSIGDYAFFMCESITSIIIPNSVTSIDDYVFKNCTSLKSVTIGDSVTSIGKWAFYDCTSLKSVTFENKTGWKVKYYGGNNWTAINVDDDLANNAKLLKSTYCDYYWKREG